MKLKIKLFLVSFTLFNILNIEGVYALDKKKWYLVEVKQDLNPRSLLINGEQKFGYQLAFNGIPTQVREKGVWLEEIAPVGTSFCLAEDGPAENVETIRAGTKFLTYDDGTMLLGWKFDPQTKRTSNNEVIELTCSKRVGAGKFSWSAVHPLQMDSNHYKDILVIKKMFQDDPGSF